MFENYHKGCWAISTAPNGIALLSSYIMVTFQRKWLQFKNYDDLQLLVKSPQPKCSSFKGELCSCEFGPTERNQGFV